MYKRIALLISVALFVGLLYGANTITGRILDSQLAPLLTRVLGLPVTLAPIRARLLSLSATSESLVMGDPSAPAVMAQAVEVHLDLGALLGGEVRFTSAQAKNLVVQADRWPRSDGPAAQDYQFLEQWLPHSLRLQAGRYQWGDSGSYPLLSLDWQRTADGAAKASWAEQHARGTLEFTTRLASLEDLLRLQPIALALEMRSQTDDSLELRAQASVGPGTDSAYQLALEVQGSGIKGTTTLQGIERWRLPTQSQSHIETLDLVAATQLFNAYFDQDADSDLESLLNSKLPVLEFPQHIGAIDIDKMSLQKEVLLDSRIEFETTTGTITFPKLHAQGAIGVIDGNGGIDQKGEAWDIKLAATISAREAGAGLAPAYINSDWHWRNGSINIHGTGEHWGSLLDSLDGELDLGGVHNGPDNTPIHIKAQLDKQADRFGLEQLQISLGKSSLKGAIVLSGANERHLQIKLTGDQLDLSFLIDPGDQPPPGMRIPEYLAFAPGLEMDWDVALSGFRIPGLTLGKLDLTLRRTPEGGHLSVNAQGTTSQRLQLELQADTPADAETDLTLELILASVDLNTLLQQPAGLLESRTSGNIKFSSRGDNIQDLFRSLNGKAQLELVFRGDDNWTRPSRPEEKIQFSGNAGLVLTGDNIVGVAVTELDIASITQDVTGSLSLVTGRNPWLIAELEAQRLNIDQIMQWLPASPEAAQESDLLESLRKLGALRISLQAQQLLWLNRQMTDVSLRLSSDVDSFLLEELTLGLDGDTIKGKSQLRWTGDLASFSAEASMQGDPLSRFLDQHDEKHNPAVSGQLKINSEGKKIADLLAGLQGSANLNDTGGDAGADSKDRRHLDLRFLRLKDGVKAEISSLRWGTSELQGSIRYHKREKPLVEIVITGGQLALEPWEKSKAELGKGKDDEDLAGFTESTGRIVRTILSTPSRMLSPTAPTPAGGRYFSTESVDVGMLDEYDLTLDASLDQISSRYGITRDLTLQAQLLDSKLTLNASSPQINGGKIEIQAHYDAADPALPITLEAEFENLYDDIERSGFSRSGHISVTSAGNSEAQLASNVSGEVYLTLGEGPMAYNALNLLAQDVASTALNALIPGSDKKQPQLECGVSLFRFAEGLGATPHGYALRTRRANLVGRVQLDLHKETIEADLNSSSRTGAGLSVGNVFSNTVEIKGSLTDPDVVPRPGALLWRGWAAFMTAGLSVVGESVLKRALASDNPCEAVQKKIREDLCKADRPIAQSAYVCPTDWQAAK